MFQPHRRAWLTSNSKLRPVIPGRSSPSRSPPSLVRPWVTPSLVLPQKAAGGPGPHHGPSPPTCHTDSQSSKTNRAPAALGLGRCCAPSQDQVEPWSRRPGRCWPLAQGRCQCQAAATPLAACTECRLLAQEPVPGHLANACGSASRGVRPTQTRGANHGHHAG